MSKTLLSDMTWEEAKSAAEDGKVAVVPVGSTEEHGLHLPLDTDVYNAYKISVDAAETADCVVAPPINYGYNEGEMKFPGTVSIRPDVFIEYVFDVCHSLTRHGFDRIVLVNGHGWNDPLLQAVTHRISKETPALCALVTYWKLVDDIAMEVRESKVPGGMNHAGEFETSLAMFLRPELVKAEKRVTEIGFSETKYSWRDLVVPPKVYLAEPWHMITKSGVVGDPTKATAEKGRKLFETVVQRLAEFLKEFKSIYR